MPLSPTDFQKALDETLAEFLPYQRRYIADQSRFVIVEKAVRVGYTYAHSFKSSLKRVARNPALKKSNELFASKNRTTASELLGYHKKWAEYWNSLFGTGFIDLSRWTSERAVYPGGDILILSSDPNAFRGMEGDVSLDEFSFHEQQAALFSAAQSRIQWLPDGQVHLISSHSHPETVFARLAERAKNGDPQWSHHKTTIIEAADQGLALKVPGIHRDILRIAFPPATRPSSPTSGRAA